LIAWRRRHFGVFRHVRVLPEKSWEESDCSWESGSAEITSQANELSPVFFSIRSVLALFSCSIYSLERGRRTPRRRPGSHRNPRNEPAFNRFINLVETRFWCLSPDADLR
jgi:hypothetical protein